MYTVHKALVTAKSLYFNKALNMPCKESLNNIVQLPGQDSEAFGLYLKSLYFGKIYSNQSDDLNAEFNRLASVAILADYVQDSTAFNLVVDAIIEVAETTEQYPLTLAGIVYEQMPAASPLRRLIRDFWVWLNNPDWFELGNSDCTNDVVAAPKEFWIDVAKELIVVGAKAHVPRTKKPWVRDRCSYHVHPDGKVCGNR
jgi:hypothetical protein